MRITIKTLLGILLLATAAGCYGSPRPAAYVTLVTGDLKLTGGYLERQNGSVVRLGNGSIRIHNDRQTRDALVSLLRVLKVRMGVIARNMGNTDATRDETGEINAPNRMVMVIKDDGSYSIEAAGNNVMTVFNPGHPDANENGFIRVPNINLPMEMADMALASGTYEQVLGILERFDPSIVSEGYQEQTK